MTRGTYYYNSEGAVSFEAPYSIASSRSTIAPVPEQCQEVIDRLGEDWHAEHCGRHRCQERARLTKTLEHPERFGKPTCPTTTGKPPMLPVIASTFSSGSWRLTAARKPRLGKKASG